MADTVDTIWFKKEGKTWRAEVIKVTHLRWEVAIFVKNGGRYAFVTVDEHSDEYNALRNFQQYIDMNVVAEFRKKGRTTKIVDQGNERMLFNAYVDGKRTQYNMTPLQVIGYLANAAEDGS